MHVPKTALEFGLIIWTTSCSFPPLPTGRFLAAMVGWRDSLDRLDELGFGLFYVGIATKCKAVTNPSSFRQISATFPLQ